MYVSEAFDPLLPASQGTMAGAEGLGHWKFSRSPDPKGGKVQGASSMCRDILYIYIYLSINDVYIYIYSISLVSR